MQQHHHQDFTDEQRKNDLIAAKLSKLEGKSKSPSKKASASNEKSKHRYPELVKKEPDDEDLPLTVARSAVVNHEDDNIIKQSKSAVAVANSRGGSGRKKVSYLFLMHCIQFICVFLNVEIQENLRSS